MANPLIHTVHIPELVVPDKRLGRHIRHDLRSLMFYRHQRTAATITSQDWAISIPPLDQGDLGSCVGNASCGCAATVPIFPVLPEDHPALDEAEAVVLYSAATKLDPYRGAYPPTDTGSDGLSGAKATKAAGFISGYTHCADVDDMSDALQSGPVIVGVSWFDSFDEPDAQGTISIAKGAQVRGGHEFLVHKLDEPGGYYGARQSWGPDWAVEGEFRFTIETMDELFAEGGDCTVFLPNSTPAPTPTPPVDVDEALWQIAGPWAAERRTRPDLVTLKAALETWSAAKGF
jgi:hypothetical protein